MYAMPIYIVQLGTPRRRGEGPRLGTVRRPPRGVRKECYKPDDWFDVWYPDLAPSAELMAQGKAAVTETEWKGFVRAFKAEMDVPTARRTLDLLAALSYGTNSAATAKTRPAAIGLCFANY